MRLLARDTLRLQNLALSLYLESEPHALAFFNYNLGIGHLAGIDIVPKALVRLADLYRLFEGFAPSYLTTYYMKAAFSG